MPGPIGILGGEGRARETLVELLELLSFGNGACSSLAITF